MNIVCDYWPIFRQLDPKLLYRIRSFMVLEDEFCHNQFDEDDDDDPYERLSILLVTTPLVVSSDIVRNLNYGTVYGFGKNWDGLLGVGHQQPVIEPTELVEFRNREVVQMTHGERHCLALTSDGEIWSWGHNDLGQLGLESDCTKSLRPKVIGSLFGKKIISIKSGRNHCLALTKFGRVYSWGNHDNRLILPNMEHPKLIGTSRNTYRPNKIKTFKKDFIVQIECGNWHSLALTDDGRLFIWSDDFLHGDSSYKFSPIMLNLKGIRFQSISAGDSHSLVLTDTGAIMAFGMNHQGQLGCHSTTDLPSPINWLVSDQPIQSCVSRTFTRTEVRFGSIFAHHNLSIGQSRESGNCFVWGCLNNNSSSISQSQNSRHSTDDACIGYPCQTLFTNLDQTMAAYSVPRDTPHLIDLRTMLNPLNYSLYNNESKLSIQTHSTLNVSNPVMCRLSRLFNESSGSDLKFIIESKSIHCHRGYLRLSSEYMNTMLSDRWLDSDTVTIGDYPFRVYYQYLRYLYTGTLELNDGQEQEEYEVEVEEEYSTIDTIEQILNLAKCFMETSLIQECQNQLMRRTGLENCCHLFELAKRLELPELEQFVIRFVCGSDVLLVCRTEGFQEMDADLCKVLMNAVGRA